MSSIRVLRFFAALAIFAAALPGQQPAPQGGLTISEAVQDASRNYPSIRVSQEQINAAAAGIQTYHSSELQGHGR